MQSRKLCKLPHFRVIQKILSTSSTTTYSSPLRAMFSTSSEMSQSRQGLCEPKGARNSEQCAEWKVRVMREVARQGLITEDSPLAFLWNLTEFQRQIQEAKDAFPSHFLHTVASKANPLIRIMEVRAICCTRVF